MTYRFELRLLVRADGTETLQFREITTESYWRGSNARSDHHETASGWRDVPTVQADDGDHA